MVLYLCSFSDLLLFVGENAKGKENTNAKENTNTKMDKLEKMVYNHLKTHAEILVSDK